MAPARFHVTYDIVTYESAEHGDAAERGYIHSGGWHSPSPNDCFGDCAERHAADNALTLREAVDCINWGCLHDNGDGSFYEQDAREDYRTGNTEIRAFHCPRTITPASLDRIRRILKVRF